MIRNIKVGTNAWCLINGKGSVVKYDRSSITVKFLTHEVVYDCNGGQKFPSGVVRTLYFSPPIITAENEPQFVPYFKRHEVVIATHGSSSRSGKMIIVDAENVDCIMDVNGVDYLKSIYTFFRVGEEVYMPR